MKTLIFTIIVAISSSFSACLSQSVPEMPAVPVAKGEKRAVLVELGTEVGWGVIEWSEGHPPAGAAHDLERPASHGETIGRRLPGWYPSVEEGDEAV